MMKKRPDACPPVPCDTDVTLQGSPTVMLGRVVNLNQEPVAPLQSLHAGSVAAGFSADHGDDMR